MFLSLTYVVGVIKNNLVAEFIIFPRGSVDKPLFGSLHSRLGYNGGDENSLRPPSGFEGSLQVG